MSFDYSYFESRLAGLSDIFEAETHWRNSLDNFSDILALNSAREQRLAHARENWKGEIFYYLNEPPNFACLSPVVGGYKGVSLSLSEILNGPSELDYGPLLLTNNHLAYVIRNAGFEGISAVRALWAKNLLLVHDYDNHHWFQMSFLGQAMSDFYFPGHPLSGYVFHYDLKSLQSPIPIGSIQWTKEFLAQNYAFSLSGQRRVGPLGKHHAYPKFTYRNRVVTTMSSHCPDVALLDASSYARLPDEARLAEWCGVKLHLVVPVARDIPIRFFDALVTGGIPLIPVSLERAVSEYGVPKEFYVCYDLADIVNPTPLIAHAEAYFDSGGQQGILERVLYGVTQCHVDTSVAGIMNVVKKTTFQ